MKKEIADNLIESLAWMEAPIGKLAECIENDGMSDEERGKLKRSISEIFKGHFEIMMFVSNRYPEYDPDKEGKESYKERVKKYEIET